MKQTVIRIIMIAVLLGFIYMVVAAAGHTARTSRQVPFHYPGFHFNHAFTIISFK